ncbi:host attachment family protein [Altererythrobacter sp. ZODW24]|uniref:host attachment family protein n=1 Tax=Altererythrobacter sp. ZODW24 TaxID=2185142 RepID=UPI000DF78ED9|nr:host attachment family protein [Altererythrobacter sp. ZODW24]
MKLARGTMLLIVDGSQMLLLRNDGDTVVPDLAVIAQRKVASSKNREILSDAPGIGFASGGHGRDTYDKADPHQENEDRFVADAAKALAQAAAENKGSLIVVAPPTALGVLRRHYDQTVKQRLIAEISKDFTNHPVDEVARLIMSH